MSDAFLGLDRSGNDNNFTVTNMTLAADQMLDTPTNNFATLNPLDRHSYNVLSEGNLKTVNTSGGGHYAIFATMAFKTGKWYAEFRRADGNNWKAAIMGIEHDGGSHSVDSTVGNVTSDVNKVGYGINVNTGNKTHDTTNASYGSEIDSILMWAFDADNGKIWWGEDGTWFASGDPAAGSNEAFSSIDTDTLWTLGFHTYDGHNLIANFGQDSSFAGAVTAQGNQDDNGIGDFYYDVPAGFMALCTSNLPTVAVTPSEHFNTVLYTGNNTTNAITGVGFQPDLLWIKERSTAAHHQINDAIRGRDNVLRTSSEIASQSSGVGKDVVSFDSDGFTLGAFQWELVNLDTETYVAWNWLAGNTTLGTGEFTQGDIASTCSRNVDAGFSIVSYTGTGSTGTVGHGLSSAPDMILVKNVDDGYDWRVYHSSNTAAPETDYLELNDTAATADDAGEWNDTAPDADVFTVGGDNEVNKSSDAMIAYCWHSIDGYSKVGSYTGSGGTDGTFVYTGFRPAFVLIKRSNSAGQQAPIYDSARDTYNETVHSLKSEDSAAELTNQGSLDLLSNGFKARNNEGSTNTDGGIYIYLAFAETPFKYSNAR